MKFVLLFEIIFQVGRKSALLAQQYTATNCVSKEDKFLFKTIVIFIVIKGYVLFLTAKTQYLCGFTLDYYIATPTIKTTENGAFSPLSVVFCVVFRCFCPTFKKSRFLRPHNQLWSANFPFLSTTAQNLSHTQVAKFNYLCYNNKKYQSPEAECRSARKPDQVSE